MHMDINQLSSCKNSRKARHPRTYSTFTKSRRHCWMFFLLSYAIAFFLFPIMAFESTSWLKEAGNFTDGSRDSNI